MWSLGPGGEEGQRRERVRERGKERERRNDATDSQRALGWELFSALRPLQEEQDLGCFLFRYTSRSVHIYVSSPSSTSVAAFV